MDNGIDLIRESIPDQQAAMDLMERVVEVAHTAAVFSPPIERGDYTVITASEVAIGLGFGYGGGGASSPQAEQGEAEASTGYGGGGGGGGGAGSRPVAVIEIGPHGVRVEPVVDPTKILLAFFTTLGAMFMMFSRMRQQASG